MQGTWRSRGYGWLLRIDDAGYELAHVTQKNRVIAERGSRADFERSFDRIAVEGSRLSLHQAGDLTRYDFDRLAEPPQVPVIEPGTVLDAAVNFETLWQTFDEHYAFFDLHNADWAESHRLIRSRVTPNMPDEELLEIFSELLLPLDDGHVSVSAGARHVQTLKSLELRRGFRKAFDLPSARVSPRSTVDAVAPKLGDLLLQPFAERTALKQAGNGIVSWCRLQPEVGYLSVLRLFGFADTDAARRADDLPHERLAVAAFLRDDLGALEQILDDAIADLGDCRQVILDLRINGGGFDRAGLAIASRFASEPTLAFTKRARDGKGFTASQELRLQPFAKRFSGSVTVLTSPLCVSAGEICVLALRALPQVKTSGQPTAGMLSDNLNKRLPNGWEFSLSNEIYSSHDGEVFEGRGIPPQELLPLSADAFVESMRAQLQQTIASF